MIDRPDWYLRLGSLIHDVSRLRRVVVDRALKPLGITRSQWWVLAFLSRRDGMTQTALAADLDLTKVAIGGLLDRMEAAGFVERRADQSDGRARRVYLTRAGAKMRYNICMTVFNEKKQDERLKELRLREEEQLAEMLSKKYNIEYVDLTSKAIDTDALRLVTEAEGNYRQET